jgi:hypothetical protein
MRVEDSEEMTDINIKGALFGIVAALAENRDRYGTDLAGINLPFQLVRRANEPLGVRAQERYSEPVQESCRRS